MRFKIEPYPYNMYHPLPANEKMSIIEYRFQKGERTRVLCIQHHISLSIKYCGDFKDDHIVFFTCEILLYF